MVLPSLTRDGSVPPPTPRMLEVAAAIVQHGSRRAAGLALGITEHTIANHVTDLLHRTNSATFIEALVALGWLDVPRKWREVRCICGVSDHPLSSVGTPDECPAMRGYRVAQRSPVPVGPRRPADWTEPKP